MRASRTKNITSRLSVKILINIRRIGEIVNTFELLRTARTEAFAPPYSTYPPTNVMILENDINVSTKKIVASNLAVIIFERLYGLTSSNLIVPLSVSPVIRLHTSIIANTIIITVQSSIVKYMKSYTFVLVLVF